MCKLTLISDCFVRPKTEVQDSQKYYHFPPLALRQLSIGNSQYGLLFTHPSSSFPSQSNFFTKLKHSLSQSLVYFYPLAGRLVTQKHPENHTSTVFVDCTKGPGARLIHASAPGLAVNDITDLGQDVPLVVQSFFDLGDRQVNHDGHTRALLSIQLTELDDGFFIGCCINHCLADANSVSHFLNVLSQVFVGAEISRFPVFQLSSPLSELQSMVKLPYLEPDEFVNRFDEGELRDRVFCFPSESTKNLKAKANSEANKGNDSYVNISSFKALCGHLWMSVTRARKALPSEETTFVLTANFRSRLNPPLSPNFFASFIAGIKVTVKVAELLTNGLGWATMMIHQKVEEALSDDKVISERFLRSPALVNFGSMGANTVIMGGSPWLDLYGADFGIGKPVAVRTGYTNRINGKMLALPGQHGSGSVDVQISLLPEIMSELLLDEEFMNYVS